ncbi:MAG: hypothetical protein ABIH92_02060 [Nanoarchaeota archaeon]
MVKCNNDKISSMAELELRPEFVRELLEAQKEKTVVIERYKHHDEVYGV